MTMLLDALLTRKNVSRRWECVRPGLHRLVYPDGFCAAGVERGSVTGRWFWTTENGSCVSTDFRAAKKDAEESVDHHLSKVLTLVPDAKTLQAAYRTREPTPSEEEREDREYIPK